MEYDVFFESVSGFVNEIDMYVGVVRIDFAAAFVDGQEHGLDAGGGLRHQACRTCRRNGEAGDVATSVFLHFLV